jgi:hypothetical protein
VAAEVREFAVTIPHGTPVGNPVTVDVSFPERLVRQVNWRVPPGPAGLMGWILSSDKVPVIPVQPGKWIIAADQSGEWPLTGYQDSGNWQVTGYNTGTFDHTVYLTFLLDLVGQAVLTPVLAAAGGAATGLLSGAVDVAS